MEQVSLSFNSAEMPIIANFILSRYKRDKGYFEQYSPEFNHEFLVRFEEEVNFLIRCISSRSTGNMPGRPNEKTQILLSNFVSVLNNMEMFLRRNFPVTGIYVTNFSLKEVKESLHNGCVREIQRSCVRLINQMELNVEEFIDKGFISILISDLHLLIRKLNDLESEPAETTPKQGVISDEYHNATNHLEEILNTIIQSTAAVFGDDDSARKKDYSLERIMLKAKFSKSNIH